MNQTVTLKIDDIKFRKDLYPRIEHDPSLVQRYMSNIDRLPPIEVNQDYILIDGFHRITAHKKAEQLTIEAYITETTSEREVRRLASKRNNAHGWQMDEKSKHREAVWLYAAGQGDSKEIIADALSVTVRTVNRYLSDIDKQLREARKETILNMWMACATLEEISEATQLHKDTVSKELETLSDLGQCPISDKVLANFEETETLPDKSVKRLFDPPLFNIWTFSKKTNGVSHFGNSEQRIVDNLLYLYTEPFDIVVDPFAGGGSTIDVCKRRLRRYYVSDRKPIVERESEIRKNDLAVDGLPPLHNRWSDVTLTYLDPPYWRQAAGQYSDDPTDLANMPLELFTKTLADIVKGVSRKQSKGVIALLIQPTQWSADNKQFTDHVNDLVTEVGNKRLVLENRVSCPYSTEQYNAQQVEYAKANKKLLVLTRELIIWRIV